MRAVVQRVARAKVTVAGEITGEIGGGLLVFLGVGRSDSESDALYLLEKIVNLRIFEDADDKMNLSLAETGGALLIVSQFTLHGDVRRGRRPSFIDAAPPESAETLYEFFVVEARNRVGLVQTGKFQAMMAVELVNDGPVTILLDSEKNF